MSSADEMDQLLAGLGLDAFDEETKVWVDQVLSSGQSVEPDTRHKLVLAAQRGIREHQYLHGPFEALAFEVRKARPLDPEDLAKTLGISADDLRAIENGTKSLIDQKGSVVADWIHQLGIAHEDGYKAVERSVHSLNAMPAYAATTGDAEFTERAEKFLEDVRKALNKLD
jgi:hypothetical protein